MTGRVSGKAFAGPIACKRAAVMLAAGLAAGAATAAGDWPALRHGVWEVNRTIEGRGPAKSMQVNRCFDPTEDMKRQNEMLTRGGCTFSPITRSGNVYTYSATCKMQGMSGTSKSVLTVDGDSANTIRVESDFGGEVGRELLRARRVGDCPR